MCVIAKVGCLQRLAHAAGHGRFLGASAAPLPSLETVRVRNIDPTLGDHFPETWLSSVRVATRFERPDGPKTVFEAGETRILVIPK